MDLAASILPVALFLIMLGVGMTLSSADFLRVIEQPRTILIGLFGQLLILPLLGWAVVTAFALPAELAVGLMILCFAPGGATSNMLTLLARGDTALSVSLTAIAGLIIPFTLPLLTFLVLTHWLGSEQSLNFPVGKSILQIILISVLPTLTGMLIAARFPRVAVRLLKPVKLVSVIFLLAVILGMVSSNAGQLVDQLRLLGPATLVLASLAMLAGHWLGRIAGLSADRQLTLAIEVGVQNAGTALLVTGALLQNPVMSISALTYGVVMQLPALSLVLYRNRQLWQRRGDRPQVI